MTSPIEKGAAAMGDTTVKAPAVTSKATATSSGKFDFAAAFASAKAQGGGTTSGTGGAVFTKQEADYAVQAVYQQLLGRNATGNDYSKAINMIMSQSQDTSTAGRQQALTNAITMSPEYKIKQDNKYLESIYNAVAANVRKAQV
jgi:hypothetical protein